MLTFRLADLPSHLREQAASQLAPRSTPKPKPKAKSKSKSSPQNSPFASAPSAPPSVPASSISLSPVPLPNPSSVSAPPVVSLSASQKMTKTEARFNNDILHGCGRFEAITLHLPGGSRYTPDFFFFDGNTPVLAEVKGSYRLNSESRAFTAFREAAASFSSVFRFIWATQAKDGSFSLKMAFPAASESAPASAPAPAPADQTQDLFDSLPTVSQTIPTEEPTNRS